jgi:S-DNA-T family DNA segregation ATPase FtsK/SpoIIIE
MTRTSRTARTAAFGTGGLTGGMRGSKANELIVVQPRPTLTTVLLTNLCRLLGRLVVWASKHPASAAGLVVATALWFWVGATGLGATALLAVVGLLTWRRMHPGSFRLLVVSRWRGVWVYRRRWQPAMHTCGLSVDLNAREYLPRVRRVVARECVDTVHVDLLSGQAPEQYEAAVSQLAHTFGATRCRVVVDRPGRIVLEFTHKDPLTEPLDALGPAPVPDLAALPLGRCEDGTPWRLRLLGTHLLVAGATGSGKGSVVWSMIRALGPAIRDRSVQVWAIDPKGGMELTPGAGLFTRFAYGDPGSMVALLEDAVYLMRERAERLRCAGLRSHSPSPADPLIVVIVDEMAALTAYAGDRDLKKRAEAALQLLLSQGRAPGVLVVAAVQDPGKDVIGFRDLFPSRVALRLLEDVQVDMVLGRSARQRGAECDRIPASMPGVGYVVQEGVREPVRVRAAYVSDADLTRMVEEYRPGLTPEQVERAQAQRAQAQRTQQAVVEQRRLQLVDGTKR